MPTLNLQVGCTYPRKIPGAEGAIADFLRSYNTLIIAMPEINKYEAQALKKGALQCGLLSKNGAVLLLWQFSDKQGRPILTLDSPFDARNIPDIKLHDVTNDKTRLLIDIHIIDSATNIIKGLRAVTMPPDLTIAFLSATQDQLTNVNNGDSQMKIWLQKEPNKIIVTTKKYLMGE